MSVCVLVHVCVCVGVCVSENGRDISTTQPDRKVCVSNCSNGWGETLWAWPAPEVWTDGCSGVHRKVFGVSVVLMFMASWLHLSQAYQRDRMRHEKQTKQNHKSVFVCLCLFLLYFVSCLLCFGVKQQATIIKMQLWCVWLSILLSVSNQQNEFPSKWKKWHSTSHSIKRCSVNSVFNVIHLVIEGCCNWDHWKRKCKRNNHALHQKARRSVGSYSIN